MNPYLLFFQIINMHSDILYSISTAVINTNNPPLLNSWIRVNKKTHEFCQPALQKLYSTHYISLRAKRFNLPISINEYYQNENKWINKYRIRARDLLVFTHNQCSIAGIFHMYRIPQDKNIVIAIDHKKGDPYNINYWDIEGDITITPEYKIDPEFIPEIQANRQLLPNNISHSYFINNGVKTHFYYHQFLHGEYDCMNNKFINRHQHLYPLEYALYSL
jgi:hypothetical protein